MSFNATTWVEDMGFLESFGIYSGALGITALGLPLVYFYGKRIRAFTAGKLGAPATTTRRRRRKSGVQKLKEEEQEQEQEDIKVHVEVSRGFEGFGKA